MMSSTMSGGSMTTSASASGAEETADSTDSVASASGSAGASASSSDLNAPQQSGNAAPQQKVVVGGLLGAVALGALAL